MTTIHFVRTSGWRRAGVWLALLLAGALLAACGGVGEEGTGIQPGTASVGALTGIADSSLTVNGVVYERSGASITDGVGRALAADDLRLGMWLEVQGSIDDSGAQGVAQSIRVRPAARGVVTQSAQGGMALTLFDSTTHLDSGSVLDGVPDALALAAGDLVEVHGPLRNGSGDVGATRVEKLHPQGAPAFELRGRVTQLDTIGHSLKLGRQAVSYASATVALRAALANGQTVRVAAAAAPLSGAAWVVDRLVTDQDLPDNLGFLYTEGFVDALTSGPVFLLEGLAVDASSANGKFDIRANGQRVAVVGALVNGTLKAKSVAVIQPGEPVVFTLSGLVTDFVSQAAFRLRGVGIDASTAVYVAPAAAAALANGVKIRIKGTVLGRRIVASQVELQP